MQNFNKKKDNIMNYIKSYTKILTVFFMTVGMLSSCTDLEIEETDSILATGFEGLTAEEASSSINAMYNSLNGYIGDQANLFALSEVTTDALLIPTRGSDWGDNGIWRQLHQHSWTPDHAFITNVWNQWNELQLTGSEVIDDRSGATAENRANAHFLRALGMYVILDNFGQVPFRDTNALPSIDPAVFSGAEAVSFIAADLEAAIAGLPAGPANGDYNRGTKTAARYLYAKLMLNKHVFTNTTAAAADMAKVVSLVDEITASGYQLQTGYFDIFKADADTETIWYIPTGVGNRILNGLHYNSTELGGGGWNGFSTLAEYYDLFEGDANNNRLDADGNAIDSQEERRGGVPKGGIANGASSDPLINGDDNEDGFIDGSNVGNGFLVGQQYAPDGTALKERAGSPLSFTRDFTNAATGAASLIDNGEVSGIRLMKYNPRFGAFKEHEIFFRYSDAYLMKAEAMMRSGQDATLMVNTLRTTRGASPIGSVTEQDLIDERGRELFVEFWRRNDLIRFGQYTKDWEFKDPSAVGNLDKHVFPIPASQLILNPNLVQNSGY
jgi:hypothetical protein